MAPHHRETNQAFPVKLFDWMASGRPIVASDIEVVREIVADPTCWNDIMNSVDRLLFVFILEDVIK